MEPKNPLNIWDIDMDKYCKENFLKEVTSMFIYEPSSKSFHPEGLFSELIFGQIGSPERTGTLAYIDLNCQVLSPISYINILKVCSWYENIINGKTYVKWNSKDCDFIPCEKDDPEANTGFSYFISNIGKVEFVKNSSLERGNRIRQLEGAIAKGTHLWSKNLVCPAGWRDVKITSTGREEIDEVNNLYLSLIAITREIRTGIESPELAKYFDGAKYHVQLKVVEIFEYWKNFFEGKSGFGQGSYIKRRLALGTRNVITSAPLLSESPDDIRTLKHNETQVPLYQAAKALEPMVVHALNTMFYAPVYTPGSTSIMAINPKTLESEYIEVDSSDVTYALGSQSKHDFINMMKNEQIRQKPVTVTDTNGKEYYFYLVYDTGDKIYLARNLNELKRHLHAGSAENNNTEQAIGISDCPILTDELLDKYVSEVRGEIISRLETPEERMRIANIKVSLSATPIQPDGTPDKEPNPFYGGCYIDDGRIVVNPHIRDTIATLNNTDKLKSIEVFHQIVRNVIAHEYMHDLYRLSIRERKNADIIARAEQENYTTKYLKTFDKQNDPEKYRKELFCEYMSNIVFPYPKEVAPVDNPVSFDIKNVRPLTNIEMLYFCTNGIKDKYCTITRYPIENTGSIYPSKMVIVSTAPSRCVDACMVSTPDSVIKCPHYPVYQYEIYDEGTIIHPSKTTLLTADFDGDKISLNAVLSKEAIDEIKEQLQMPMDIITPDGRFLDTLDTMTVSYALYAMTRVPPDTEFPTITD